MASKRRIRRKMCGKKRRYNTQEEAVKAIYHARLGGVVTGKITAYKCPFCGGFHWGHKPKGVTRGVK